MYNNSLKDITILTLSLFLGACSVHDCCRVRPEKDRFVLCHSVGILDSICMGISKKEPSYGFHIDAGFPLERCSDREIACIKYPIPFAKPPYIPRKVDEEYSWVAGDIKFRITRLSTEGEFSLIASYYHKKFGWKVYEYLYKEGHGVRRLSYYHEDQGKIVREKYSVCSGSLEFSDLRHLDLKHPNE